MVFESFPWKQDLLKNKEIILQYNTEQELNKDDTEDAETLLQKAIFYSAFIIRKLIDCHVKTSDDVDNYKLKVARYNALKHFVPTDHWPDEKSHDWEHPISEQHDGRNVCNWLIHSFFFMFRCNDSASVFDGFYVASDYDKDNQLYCVQMSDWLDYIDFVANDDIISFSVRYGIENGERVIVSMKKTRGDMSLGLLDNATLLADSKKTVENKEGNVCDESDKSNAQ